MVTFLIFAIKIYCIYYYMKTNIQSLNVSYTRVHGRHFFVSLFLTCFIFLSALYAEKIPSRKFSIELWKGIKGVKESEQSVLFASIPQNQNGTSVIICPGGSYHHLGLYNEGYKSAQWFNSLGVASFNFRYRVAEGGCHFPCQLEDIERAVLFVREHAAEYGIDPNRIGVIGFSAGGHLALMSGAFSQKYNELAKFGVDTDVSMRPSFVIPIYPVVSMRDDIANIWSRKSLLGKDMSEEHKEQFSMEKQIPDDMPPTYVLACKDDPVVQFENSVLLCQTLEAKKIPYRFAVYDKGGHGFGMLANSYIMKTYHWNEDLAEWLKAQGFLPK
jgi:acetyl esterase/lipase